MAEQVISRIKVMSELDIAERRVPQDGRFTIALNRRPIDFRVSVIPSIFGEDAVLRALDKQALTEKLHGLRLDALGFDMHVVTQLRRLSALPYGMLLVTGPTGSGKTTTLYAAISETQTGSDKIVTIEDPVEYQLKGVLQIPVNEKKGLTFARGLRSILRHDPDKIMVGEIRDSETAQIAIQSALTGHLVFTTVHANNVFDVVSRFTHMGVDTYSFVSALSGVLAQRLIRVVCEQCAEPHVPSRAAAGGIAALRGRERRLQLHDRPRLPTLPRQRLSRPQSHRGTLGAERRAARGDHQPGAGPAAEGTLAEGRGAADPQRRARSGSARRNHPRGGQSCHRYGVTRLESTSPSGACVSSASGAECARSWRGRRITPNRSRRPAGRAALALLEQQLAARTWSDARVRAVIADQWVRYAVVPWSDALNSNAERLAHARELLAGVFGEPMTEWTVSLSDAPPGESRLASAIPAALLESLRATTARHGQKLASVQPQLIAAYNTWRHILPAAEAAWFVTVDAGSLAALRMCGDGIDRVHAVRIGSDWARELKRSANLRPAREREPERRTRVRRSAGGPAHAARSRDFLGAGVAR